MRFHVKSHSRFGTFVDLMDATVKKHTQKLAAVFSSATWEAGGLSDRSEDDVWLSQIVWKEMQAEQGLMFRG